MDGDRFATGSYDERLRFWDPRALRDPTSVVRFADGAYRLAPGPRGLLVSAMRDGWHVVGDGDAGDSQRVFPVEMRESLLAYGGDWDPRDPRRFVTASFTDREVALCEDSRGD